MDSKVKLSGSAMLRQKPFASYSQNQDKSNYSAQITDDFDDDLDKWQSRLEALRPK